MPASIGKCVSLTALMTLFTPSPHRSKSSYASFAGNDHNPKGDSHAPCPRHKPTVHPAECHSARRREHKPLALICRRRACVKNEACGFCLHIFFPCESLSTSSTCTASGDTQTELITIGPNEEATPLYNDSEPVSQAAKRNFTVEPFMDHPRHSCHFSAACRRNDLAADSA